MIYIENPVLRDFVQKLGVKFGSWRTVELNDPVGTQDPNYLGSTKHDTDTIYIKGDRVVTPDQQRTLLHEITHWSGNPFKRRVKRVTLSSGLGFASNNGPHMALEELVAELGANMLARRLGVTDKPFPRSREYIDSYLWPFVHLGGMHRDEVMAKARELATESTRYLLQRAGKEV